ncbi:pathogenesis-related protein 1-like [Pomacea canaliculata]|uniref:pathogenesis-related protein 1-like n=1 Tax=Pomacea canaliculata TaxID=400727 RepID=UPI000D7259F6|nr:pathogenesis-related protein 1-like [Pomacea canaliculata]XP_025110281.1 pathogenesis-related protein 1-like [Pomacea canaliculata]
MACLLMTVAVAAVSLLAVQGTFQTDILGDLNRARQGEHVNKPLTWSAPLATQSKNWASQCKFQHSGLAGASEIIFMTFTTGVTATKVATDSLHAWMSEKAQPGCTCSNLSTCGHYCIIINSKNVKVGCAMQKCANINGHPATLVVCRLSG